MKKIFFLLIPLVAIFLYYPVFTAGYVWDDNILFVNKVKLINEPLSWGLLIEPVLPNTTYFRPLIFLTIFMEFQLFGQNPLSSHVLNLIILIINAFLVSMIVNRIYMLMKRDSGLFWGLIAGVFYIVNPVLIEATAWISGRFDLLVTMFTLLGILIFISQKNNNWINAIAISLCFLLALFSKELGIVFPILIFFIYMYLNVEKNIKYSENIRNFFKENYKLIAVLIFTFIVYFILRLQAMGNVYHQKLDGKYIEYAYFTEYLPVHSLFFYIKQFIIPFRDLTPLIPIDDLNNIQYVVFIKGLFLILFFIVLAFGLIKKSNFVWLVLSALVTVLLVVYIVPITIANNIAHNRFMTLGAAILAVSVVLLPKESLNSNSKKILYLVLSIWMIFAFMTTKSIVPFWKNDYSLWKWTYTVQPNNELAKNSYLFGLYEQGKFKEIITEIESYKNNSSTGLSVKNQMLYVNALISLNNPEALNYAAGVDVAIPKFHLIYKNKSKYKFDAISNYEFAAFYGSYAMAVSVFKYKPKEALALNEIALWYLDEDQKIPYLYNNVAYLYQDGRVEEANKLFHYLISKSAYGHERYYSNMKNIIMISCINKKESSNGVCKINLDKFNEIVLK